MSGVHTEAVGMHKHKGKAVPRRCMGTAGARPRAATPMATRCGARPDLRGSPDPAGTFARTP